MSRGLGRPDIAAGEGNIEAQANRIQKGLAIAQGGAMEENIAKDFRGNLNRGAKKIQDKYNTAVKSWGDNLGKDKDLSLYDKSNVGDVKSDVKNFKIEPNKPVELVNSKTIINPAPQAPHRFNQMLGINP